MNKVWTMCALAVAFLGISGSAFGQFPRNVVIEEFTSATCGPCVTATPIINDIIKDNIGRVFSVRYHMNFPSAGDPWYAANPSENNGRKTHHGVIGIPASRVNGLSATPTEKGEMVQRVSDAMAETSPVKLEVTQALEGGKVNVTVKATASANEGVIGLTLMVAAVEGYAHIDTLAVSGWNKEKEFHDIFRKMISGMEGAAVDLDAGQTKTYTFSYTPTDDWQLHEMFVVAFLEDRFDANRVIQAAASPKIAAGVDNPSGTVANFSLGTAVPNPARDAVAISYSLGSPEQVVIEVRDLAGALVATVDEGRREVGTFQARLDLRGVPSGVYAYTIRAGEYRETKMLTVVR
jgi:hypothetical protein